MRGTGATPVLTGRPLLAGLLVALCACGGDEPAARGDVQSPVIDGAAVYGAHCASCHDEGRDGAPATGDVPAWVARVPEWRAVLEQHANEGFILMPAKGGNPGLSDAEVSAAVDHMLRNTVPRSVLAEGSARGRLVYLRVCRGCHDRGIDGAPAIGDVAAWAARTPNWHNVLEAHARDGFLRMPASGDDPALSDEDVAAAVAFMVNWVRR